MNAKEVRNESFYEYCQSKNIPFTFSYRQVRPNLAAMFKSFAKYDRFQPQLDHKLWRLAGSWVNEHYRVALQGSRLLPTDDVLQEMDKTTSAGYPWSLEYTDKSDFLENGPRAMIDDYWTQLGSSEIETVPIWTCSQKRELRSLEKISLNKHRTFTGGPIEFTVASNRFTLDMNNNFYGCRDTYSFVGCTKFLRQWDGMYRRLDRHPNGFELDEQDYDSSLFQVALEGVRDLRWDNMCVSDKTPENCLRFHRLYSYIIHSCVVLENAWLVLKHTGNPSGSNNTISDNTLLLTWLLFYAWLVIHAKLGIPTSYQDFRNHVEAALVGDDNTFTVSNEKVGIFNAQSIMSVWSEIGVIAKTPSVKPQPVKMLKFLSNGFVYWKRFDCWVPYPEADRVLSSLAWGSEVDDVRWHYMRACALRIDSYGNDICRVIIQDYIDYLMLHYRSQFHGVVRRPKVDIPWSMISSTYKTDSWIEGLYTGSEKEMAEGDSGISNFLAFKESQTIFTLAELTIN